MKKKLVSILLSLSMCAVYAMPLTTVAADEPTEAVEVVETVAPDAKTVEPEVETTSPSQLKITKVSGSSIELGFGETVDLTKKVSLVLAGSNTGLSGIGSSDQANYKNYEVSIPNAADQKILTLSGKNLTGNTLTKKNTVAYLKLTVNNAGFKAEALVEVTVVARDLSKMKMFTGEPLADSGEDGIYVTYDNSKDSKYQSLEKFTSKFKGAKGFTAKIKNGSNIVTLAKKDIKKVTASIPSSYIDMEDEGGTYKGINDKVATGAYVEFEGKGNYAETTTKTMIYANLEPQRIDVDSLAASGSAITYGSIVKVAEGLTVDHGTEVKEADLSKNFKFSADGDNKSCIKISNKGEVSVKKVPESGSVEVVIKSKKNKNAVGRIEMAILPMPLTGSNLKIDVKKITDGKNYRSLKSFEEKFIGKDPEKPKATGLVLTKDVGSKKGQKLKAAGKDYTVSLEDMGTQLGSGEYVKGTAPNYKITSTVSIRITGCGNYRGTVTAEAVKIPLEVQTVTGSGATPTVTFASVAKVNAFDYLKYDYQEKRATDSKTKENFKLKAGDGIKVDKDGYITVKSVPESGTSKITVTIKKNKDFDKYELPVKVDAATVTGNPGKFKIDKTKIKAEYKTKAEAVAAVNKCFVTFNGKKLKVTKDYEAITADQADLSQMTTKGSFDVKVSANLTGNYKGTVKETVKLKFKSL